MALQRRRPKELLTIVLLIFAVAVTWWWLDRAQQGDQLESAIGDQHPEAFFREVVVTTMGDDGAPMHRLTAERMDHFPNNSTAELVEPFLLVFQGEESPWEVRSKTAVAQLENDNVWLLGGVRAEHHPRNGDSLVVTTTDLYVVPKENFAQTEQPVTIEQPFGVTQGVGLRSWFKEKRFALLAQVKGRYESRSK